MNKSNCFLLMAGISLLSFPCLAFSQEMTENFMSEPILYDTIKESNPIHSHFEEGDESEDTVATNLSFSEFYVSFDTVNIHYPRGEVNFADTARLDTLFIPLIWENSPYTSATERNHVTSKFGLRKWRYHYGLDLKLDYGDPVKVCFDGIVRIAKFSKSYGNIIVVRHRNGLESYYGHLSKRLVGIGDVVKSGDVIGLGGTTGRSTGNHLHLEFRYLGNPINPEDIIDFSKGELISDTLHLSAYNYRYLKEVATTKVPVMHKVKNGETLGGLARRYGSSISQLRAWNGIASKGPHANMIRVGKSIRVR
jgi:murein DD-endopeptidase MepM/ murein hydrolase activator NlpD